MGPSRATCEAGGSVKTPAAVQLLLPEMGGIHAGRTLTTDC